MYYFVNIKPRLKDQDRLKLNFVMPNKHMLN